MVISLTEAAVLQVKEMLKQESEETYLRLGVQGGGCSGLSYSLGFDEEINQELDHIDQIDGIPIVVSKPDIPIIEGTVIDFKQNLMGGGFSINNPNAVFSCGCGSSFRTKERVGEPSDC